MKKTFFLSVLFGISVFFSSCVAKKEPTQILSQPSQSLNSTEFLLNQVKDRQKLTFLYQQKGLIFEVVNTDQSIRQGLSGRETIGSDGMLFIFSQKYRQNFWMKEMLFDLDLVWLSDLQVVEITRNVPKPPQPSTPESQLPNYAPQTPINMVLELPAGEAKKMKLQVGDTFILK
jgi:uncharacterized membrane protein (UPF0127 family)